MYSQTIYNNQSLSNDFYQQILFNIFQNVQNIDKYIANGQLKMFLTFSRFYDDVTLYTIIQLFNQYLKINCNNKPKLNRFHTNIVESNFLTWILKPLMERYFSYLPDRHNLTTIIEFFIYNLKYCNVPQITESLLSIKPLVLIAGGQFDHDQFLSSMISDLNQLNRPIKENLPTKIKKSEKVKSKNRPNKFLAISEKSQRSSTDFRAISVTPILEDISSTNKDIEIRINKFNTDKNTYTNVDDYLDLHFRLLREDFMRQLRNNIHTIKSHRVNDKGLHVRIFRDVSIGKLCVASHKFTYRIQFDKSKSNNDFNWNKEKYFMFGSLVILTNNLFDTLYTASVVHCNLDNSCKGYIVVDFNDQTPIDDVINKNNFLLFECKSPFESNKHVLKKLKEFREQTFPFKENIVYGQNLIAPPKYLKCSDVKKIEKLSYNFDNFDLDESQFDAFKSAISSNLSLIQGPPSSGKTFVALKLISYLSENFQQSNKTRNIGPILFVCTSNHKLDKFLTQLIDMMDSTSILRIGEQTKNREMENCNIQKIKQDWILKQKFPGEIRREYMYLTTKLRKLEDKLQEIYSDLTECDYDKLRFDKFNVVIKIKQKQYFRNINYEEWLSGSNGCDYSTGAIITEEQFAKPANEKCLEINTKERNEKLKREEKSRDGDIINKFIRVDNDENEEFGDHIEMNDDRQEDKVNDTGNTKWYNYQILEETVTEELHYENIENLSLLSVEDRWKVHKYWLVKYRERILNEFQSLKIKHDKLVKQYEYLQSREDVLLMLRMKVIGMTVTKAVQYGEVLEQVGCRIVIVDDAADLLESHTIAVLNSFCEQFILIGDHLQLRPKVVEIELEESYNLAISLFERFISNGWPCSKLKYQQRMRPEIAGCLKCVYPNMESHYTPGHHRDVDGMGSNMYWFNHNETLTSNADDNYTNDYEVLFIWNLCQYLIKVGNSPKQITLITFFQDQLKNFTKLIKDHQYKDLTVYNIDDCKCKENDIVIISFVRSDPIGLLKSPNHLCYALSRAKRGLYLFGNFQLLRNKIPLLSDILSNNIPEASLGSQLPLKCPQHSINENLDYKYYVTKPNDLFISSCDKACGILLKCKHKCTETCHWSNLDHQNYECNEIIEKKCLRNLHSNSVKCGESSFCRQTISITFPKCQHELDMLCFLDEKTYLEYALCEMKCGKRLKCGHNCQKKCYEECLCLKMVMQKLKCGHEIERRCGALFFRRNRSICKEKVQIILKCGHILMVDCKDKKIDEDKYKCKYLCPTKLSCGHVCGGRCGECLTKLKFHRNCKISCESTLPCGHTCRRRCHFGLDCPNTMECTSKCPKVNEINKAICNGTTEQLTTDYTTDRETILERVINTSNIEKEFQLTSLATDEKLKQLMKLILICHPDKNKSFKATEASQKLLAKKQKYDEEKE